MHHDRKGAARPDCSGLPNPLSAALDDLDLLTRAIDGVGDLLCPDLDIGGCQRENITCLFMVLHRALREAVTSARQSSVTAIKEGVRHG